MLMLVFIYILGVMLVDYNKGRLYILNLICY